MNTRKALVVGIENYPGKPLKGCCNDTSSLEKLLAYHENGTPNFAVIKKDNVQSKIMLKTLIEQCFDGNADIALFYYSGHGHIDSDDGYLVTPDYVEGDWGVKFQDVLSIVTASKCKERIIILDCCYSGFMGNVSALGQSIAVINEGVTILAASRKDESALLIGKNSLFTSFLLEALSGGAADVLGNITVGSVYAFINKSLGSGGQIPVFKTNVTHFATLREVNPRVDISIIKNLVNYFSNDNSQFRLDPSFEQTNTPEVKHEIIEPYAEDKHVKIFKDLQKLESIGLVVPVDERHMYFAAMNSKSCQLTAVGKYYWQLVKKGVIK